MPEIATLIAVLIIDRPLCVDCIADRGQISVATVKTYLERIDPMFSVNREGNGRCRACGHIGSVVSLSRRS
jgi:hypothetical protein